MSSLEILRSVLRPLRNDHPHRYRHSTRSDVRPAPDGPLKRFRAPAFSFLARFVYLPVRPALFSSCLSVVIG